MAERDGVWAGDPDIRAFWQLVEELQARETPPAPPKGHRFGTRLSGAAYYRSLELWAASPRPDIVAFRALVGELRRSAPAKEFIARLRARLAEIASLSVADQRQKIGVGTEYLKVALAGGRVPPPIAERLQALVAGA